MQEGILLLDWLRRCLCLFRAELMMKQHVKSRVITCGKNRFRKEKE